MSIKCEIFTVVPSGSKLTMESKWSATNGESLQSTEYSFSDSNGVFFKVDGKQKKSIESENTGDDALSPKCVSEYVIVGDKTPTVRYVKLTGRLIDRQGNKLSDKVKRCAVVLP